MKKYFLLVILCSLSIVSFEQIKESQAIDSIFAEWNKPNVPGCALGIIKDSVPNDFFEDKAEETITTPVFELN